MTGANMVLVTVDVSVDDASVLPDAHPDEGEYIEKELVPLGKLAQVLQGEYVNSVSTSCYRLERLSLAGPTVWLALMDRVREAGPRHRCAR